jgi:hypothetical protein
MSFDCSGLNESDAQSTEQDAEKVEIAAAAQDSGGN